MKYFKMPIIFILLFHSISYAQLAEDDLLHFGAGILSGAAGAFVASELSDGNRFWTFTGAIAGGLLAGTVKESIDKKNYNTWDNRDLGATVLGGITAGITIDLFTGKKRSKNLNSHISNFPLTKYLEAQSANY
jgi:hypothetical protein